MGCQALAANANLVSVVQNDHRLLGFVNLDYGARGFISYPLIDDIVDTALFEQLTKNAGLKAADASTSCMPWRTTATTSSPSTREICFPDVRQLDRSVRN
jgi:hypothetical protein